MNKSKKNIYDKLGVKPIINGAGTKTRFSGPILDPDTMEAMREASLVSVNLVDLIDKVGEYIAKVTHSEAGMVTNGAASGVVLSIAACMTGSNKAKVMKLPDSSRMKNEIIIQKIHRGHYSHMYTFTGAKIIEIGDLVNCSIDELEDAINENTAAINFLFGPKIFQTALSFETINRIAKKHNIPLIVDAAAMLPPKENLWKYIEAGADLVTISGGKIIRGPQNSGLLFGRKDLIEAAKMNSSPNHSIGRPHKMSKEDIVGLYTALKKYISSSDEEIYLSCHKKLDMIERAIEHLDAIFIIERKHDFQEFSIPVLLLRYKPGKGDPFVFINQIRKRNRPIYLEFNKHYSSVVINVFSMSKEDCHIVSESIIQITKAQK